MKLSINSPDHALIVLQDRGCQFEHLFNDGLRGDLECKGVQVNGLSDVRQSLAEVQIIVEDGVREVVGKLASDLMLPACDQFEADEVPPKNV